jgi:hypothetical protein
MRKTFLIVFNLSSCLAMNVSNLECREERLNNPALSSTISIMRKKNPSPTPLPTIFVEQCLVFSNNDNVFHENPEYRAKYMDSRAGLSALEFLALMWEQRYSSENKGNHPPSVLGTHDQKILERKTRSLNFLKDFVFQHLSIDEEDKKYKGIFVSFKKIKDALNTHNPVEDFESPMLETIQRISHYLEKECMEELNDL